MTQQPAHLVVRVAHEHMLVVKHLGRVRVRVRLGCRVRCRVKHLGGRVGVGFG